MLKGKSSASTDALCRAVELLLGMYLHSFAAGFETKLVSFG
jgi:hypothetical protein